MHVRQSLRRTAIPLVCLAATAAACARNPVTGKPQISLISESQEIEMGRQAAQDVVAQIGLVADSSLQSYVAGVGLSMARRSERPDLPWEFHVVDDPEPNAFALPGGFIFVTRGLMGLIDSEAELATVVGHEIGHVTAKHQVTEMSKAQIAQLGLGLGSIFVPQIGQLGQLAGTGLQLLFLKYSRDDERQADDLGFRYALQAGYDVAEMVDVFQALERLGQKQGQSPLPGWLQTHPGEPERIQRIQQKLAQLDRPAGALTIARPSYLDRIDGLVYGDNPRNGYFRENLFLHPDLRFQLTFPQGWKAQNTPQAVLAGSPQQDAVLQLTLAQGASAAAAAQGFFSQQGVQPGQTARRTVNGLSTVLGTFQATTQQGTVAGVAAFIDYAGRVYQILGYTPANLLGRYEPLFEQVIGSFAPLTDPGALAVKPKRVRLVALDRAMTLAEFARRYPSAVATDELAIIDQVSGPDAVLAAGRKWKRIE